MLASCDQHDADMIQADARFYPGGKRRQVRLLLVTGIVLITVMVAGMLASDNYGFAQPALLAAYAGALVAGMAARSRLLAGALAGLVCAGLAGAGIVIAIGLGTGVDYGVTLPVMIPLAGIPGLLLGMAGSACTSGAQSDVRRRQGVPHEDK